MVEKVDKVFMAYRFDNDETGKITITDNKELILTPAQFVHRVNYYLNKQASLKSFCYTFSPDRQDWDEILRDQLDTCNKFVLFWSGKAGDTQSVEVDEWKAKHPQDHHLNSALVKFPGCHSVPDGLNIGLQVVELEKLYEQLKKLLFEQTPDTEMNLSDELAHECAKKIHEKLKIGNNWIPPDGLPIGYPFDYEKDIIEEYVQGEGQLLTEKRLVQGCPLEWPQVKRIIAPPENFVKNPIPELTTGRHRDPKKEVIVDVRSKYHKPDEKVDRRCLVNLKRSISFLEAGPRGNICYPLSDDIRIGVVVSGGIAPGINAVIAGICTRHAKYHEEHPNMYGDVNKYQLTITMYRDGFFGMLNNFKIVLKPKEVIEQVDSNANLGGSWIGTARHDELLDSSDKILRKLKLDDLLDRLEDDQIDILYVIGGEGTMRAAHAIAVRAKQRWLSIDPKEHIPKQISVIGIPKTMDNDILWVWQAFGFLSAVEKAKEFISQLDTEARSNPRLCIVQLFGSDSGFVVSHAALASGVCKAALIPEAGFTMAELSKHIRKQLEADFTANIDPLKVIKQSPHGIILLAETAVPRDVEDYIEDPKYSELQLHEKEKEAIRRFVGSALLNPSDIKNWPLFLTKIVGGMIGSARISPSKVFELFPEPIKQIIIAYKPRTDEKKIPSEIQSLVTKALNNIIKGKELLKQKNSKSEVESISKELRNLSQCLKVIDKASQMSFEKGEKLYNYLLYKLKIDTQDQDKDQSNPLPRDPISVLQSLERHQLSYEAKARIHILIKRLSKEYLKDVTKDQTGKAKEDWVGQFNWDNKELYPEILKTYNRLFIEEVFLDHIKKQTLLGDRRVHGQTPDELRSAGLKVVSAVLKHDIQNDMPAHKEYWKQFRVFVNEPRHLIRAISPSVSDVIFGQRLGMLAVDNAMAGYTDFMVSQWLTEYVLVPLELVVLGRKRVPQNGIFWKSVLQNTGQKPTML